MDREKLEQVLNHWTEVEGNLEAEGLSFLDGMRLLSGYSDLDPSTNLSGGEEESSPSWTELHVGEWLKDALTKMRDPAQTEIAVAGDDLKATLRPYQQDGVNWLWFFYQMRLGACLADDMGLGKTIQIIALLLAIKRQSIENKAERTPSLLVIPASLLGNWCAELERFAPSLDVFCMHPSQTSAEERKSAEADSEFYNDYDLVITTYGLVKRLDSLPERSWNVLVLDEAQAIKNPNTAQTRAVKKVKAKMRTALSGTPIENKLGDLWSLFDFINPGLLGNGAEFKRFVKVLEGEGEPNYAPLRTLARPYILRRLKTDKSIISDLPDKTEMNTLCQLSKAQAVMYEQSVKELAHALSDDAPTGIQRRGMVLSFLMRFKQICNHPAQWTGTGDFKAKASGKFQRLATICEELASRQEKVLIFTQFKEMTDPLSELLTTVFGREGLTLHGGTSVKKRQQFVDEFQSEGGPPFFVLSLKAGGTGLNLTAASHVIHFDRWWNPAVEDQATDRAFRIGQKRNVMVHKFVCQGTIEEKIDRLIMDKRDLAEDILGKKGGPEKLLTEMNTNELLDFVSIDVNRAVAS